MNGAAVTAAFPQDHIVLPAAALKPGLTEVDVEFTAGDTSLNRNPDFLYALFVPARAHLAIPVFDQPDLKARWTLELKYPGEWLAVSNGASAPGRPDRPVERRRQRQRSDDAIRRDPAAAHLSLLLRRRRLHRSRRRSATAAPSTCTTARPTPRRWPATSDAIFDLHARAIAFMEDYTGIPYAFGKFDFVAIPAFQFGGMEHAGKILYNATGLLLDESATQNQYLGRASVISHETAHMWFGDLVTMRWFNDVWMKEVFANFMAAKIVNPSFPEVNHDLRFLYAHYPAAYDVDRTAGTNAIRQPLDNLNEAGSLYGAIIYQKAPIVMRHLEQVLGDDLVPRRPARIPEGARLRQRDVERPHCRCSTRARRSISSNGAASGSRARGGRPSPPSSRSTPAGSAGWPSARRMAAAATWSGRSSCGW